MLSPLVAHYGEWDAEAAALSEAEALRATASVVASALPSGRVVLLARSDAALIVCAAAAMLRSAPTRVERAHIGRVGWSPPAGAVLVEPCTLAPGMVETLRNAIGDDAVLLVDPQGLQPAIAA